MRIFTWFTVLLAAVACSDHLKSSYSSSSPGQVEVKVTSNGSVVSHLIFSNNSSPKMFRCVHDRQSTVYIDARTWVPDEKGVPVEQLFSFFFPLVANSAVATHAQWNDDAVMIAGKLGVPPRSLNGKVEGVCQASMLHTNDQLSGSVVCTSVNDTVDKFTYDLQISNLSCKIE